jgi:hypothetical protein
MMILFNGNDEELQMASNLEAPSRALANHGNSNGHRIHHLQANRSHLVRTPQGWKIQSRSFSPLNGSEQARGYLSQGLKRYRQP